MYIFYTRCPSNQFSLGFHPFFPLSLYHSLSKCCNQMKFNGKQKLTRKSIGPVQCYETCYTYYRNHFHHIAIKCWENVRTINHLFHIGNSSLTGRISGEMKRNSNGSYRGFIFMLCYYQLNADNQIELSSYFTH